MTNHTAIVPTPDQSFFVEVNKYAHAGSAFTNRLYPEGFIRCEAIRIADERASLGLDRFCIVVDAKGRTVHTAKIA
jgi:hypothetical protein